MNTDRKTYNATRAQLIAQLDAAREIEKAYDKAFTPLLEGPGGIETAVYDAWNAAHDAVSALEGEIRLLDREWDARKLDPVQRDLVSRNID